MKLGIAAGDDHSDDEFVSVSDVSVGCWFDCADHTFAIVFPGVSACSCAFQSVPLVPYVTTRSNKVVTVPPPLT